MPFGRRAWTTGRLKGRGRVALNTFGSANGSLQAQRRQPLQPPGFGVNLDADGFEGGRASETQPDCAGVKELPPEK